MKLLCFQAKRFRWKTHSKTLPDVLDQDIDQEVAETVNKTLPIAPKMNLARSEIRFKMSEEKSQEMKIALENNVTGYWLFIDILTESLVRFVPCEADK